MLQLVSQFTEYIAVKKKTVNKTKQTNKQDSNLISHLKKEVYDNEQWNNVNAKQLDYNSSYKAALLSEQYRANISHLTQTLTKLLFQFHKSREFETSVYFLQILIRFVYFLTAGAQPLARIFSEVPRIPQIPLTPHPTQCSQR